MNVFVRTNLAVVAEQGEDRTYFFASSFDGKNQPGNLEFTAYSFDAESETLVPDAKAKISYEPKRGVYSMASNAGKTAFVVAKNADFYGAVALNADEASNYDFGYVSGSDTSVREYAYVYTDRPIYRAGDQVSFKGLLRRFLPAGYAKSTFPSVKVRILDQDGQSFKEMTAKVDANSNFSATFDIPKESKTGRFNFEITGLDAK